MGTNLDIFKGPVKYSLNLKAATQWSSIKVFLKIQNLQETIFKNSCVGGFFKITFFTEHLQWLLLWMIFIIFCNWLHWVDNDFYLESDFLCVCEILLSLFDYCFLGSHTGSNACENSCIIFQMIPGKTI